ncbi:MAG: o-succinylbenzoate synthase [Caldilineae bacterium]|nr:o-succinylbenzoate synthase [Caldilineae bacterium]
MIRLETRPYRLAFRRPFVTAFGSLRWREGWVVRVRDDSGRAGFGEAAPLPGFGGGEPAAVAQALLALARPLADLDAGPADPIALSRLMQDLVGTRPELLARAPAALAAVDLALADLAARRAGLPLARWLAPAAAASVPVNASISADAPEACAAAAREAVAAGYRTIKLKLRGEDRGDLDRVAAVHAVLVGANDPGGAPASPASYATAARIGSAETLPRRAIRLDANASWSRARAIDWLERLAPYGIEYVEQPTPVEGDPERDVADLEAVHRLGRVPVAADEILLDPRAAERVLARRAAACLILKPALLGGPSRASALATRARAQGMQVVVTSALDGAVGRLGALHLAAALGLERACGLATGGLLAEDLAAFPNVGRGRLALPAGVGLGVEPAGW